MEEKQCFYVTLNVKKWDMEIKILRLFEDMIEIIDTEGVDYLSKHHYYELLVRCTGKTLRKYHRVRDTMLA